MKHINNFINEKLIINSSTKKHTIKVKNKEEFRKAVDKIIEESQDKENINLNSIDVSQLVDMTRLLRKYTNIKKLDVSSWDVSNVKSMNYMFPDHLKSVDLSDWDVSEVQTMQGMFYGCQYLEEIGDTSNWETNSLENISDMFNGCYSIKKVDMSNWNLSKLYQASQAFYGCRELESIGNITKQQLLSASKNHLDTFMYCGKLKK